MTSPNRPNLPFAFDATITDKYRKLIRKTFDDGNAVFNKTGKILSIAKTLEFLGLPGKHHQLSRIVMEQANIYGYKTISPFQHSIIVKDWIGESMRLGPHAQLLGWAIVQQPAIYAIVCEATGRKYIGSSMRPDLRRAVHLYWLKQPWRWGISNVFFGHKQLLKDVQKHGVESFYCEILESIPDARKNSDLWEAEQRHIEQYSAKDLYNYQGWQDNTAKCFRFSDLEPEMKALEKQYRTLMKKHEALVLKTREQNKICSEMLTQGAKSSVILRNRARQRALREERDDVFARRNAVRENVISLLSRLKEEYSKHETPNY